MKFGAKTLLAAAVITPLLVGSVSSNPCFANPQRLKDRAEIVLAAAEKKEIPVRNTQSIEQRKAAVLNALHTFASKGGDNNTRNLIISLKRINYQKADLEFKKQLLADLKQYGGSEFAEYFHNALQSSKPKGHTENLFAGSMSHIDSECGNVILRDFSFSCSTIGKIYGYSSKQLTGTLKLYDSATRLKRFLTSEEWQRVNSVIKQKFGIGSNGSLIQDLLGWHNDKFLAEKLKTDKATAKKIIEYLDELGLIDKAKYGVDGPVTTTIGIIIVTLLGFGIIILFHELYEDIRLGHCFTCHGSGKADVWKKGTVHSVYQIGESSHVHSRIVRYKKLDTCPTCYGDGYRDRGERYDAQFEYNKLLAECKAKFDGSKTLEELYLTIADRAALIGEIEESNKNRWHGRLDVKTHIEKVDSAMRSALEKIERQTVF